MTNATQSHISFGEFEFDPVRRNLSRNGERLPLYAKTSDLLAFLLERNGRLVTKDEILDTIWHGQMVEESNLSVQVAALRKALGEKRNSPRFLITVPGQGYKFVADVHNSDGIVIEKRSFSQFVIEEDVDEQHASRRPMRSRQSRNLVYIFSGAIVLGLFVLGALAIRYASSKQVAVSDSVPFSDGSLKQLTITGKVSNAVISPDGKFYAYTLFERGEYKNSLWLAQTDGGRDVQLRSADDRVVRGVAFSPDGKSIYFALTGATEAQAELFRMPIMGGVAEKLSNNIGPWFALSPDGNRIAFFRRGRTALVVADIHGTNELEIATRPRDRSFTAFAPAWSPDGSRLAVGTIDDASSQKEKILIVGAADGSQENLVPQDWIGINGLIWKRDGSGLIVSASSGDEPRLRHLWHIDYPAGTVARISQETNSYAMALSLTDDGESLLAVQLHRESNLWVAPADDLSQARQITFSAINGFYGWSGFHWTPDGRIIFSAGADGGTVIKSARADGGDIREITSPGFLDQKPIVTADGSRILFQSNRSGRNEIWSVKPDGSDLKQLTTEGVHSAPDVTPDGSWMVFIVKRDERSILYRARVDGGELQQVTDDATASDPRISPDGKWIAYGLRTSPGSSRKFAIVSIDDSRLMNEFEVPDTANLNQSLRWTPDGKAVCYRDWTNGIWQQNLSGGPPTKLKGLPEEKLYNFAWSRDAKHFAFTRGREIRDVVLITQKAK